ncbi:MAG: GIY-YIG nuclease family protein [Ignavibacteria bacterium]|nr:GIY-YIG nuclease family protein [Ignavibacteria bacterium]
MINQIYYVYMLTNWNNNVLYVGVTNNLTKRVYEHCNKLINGFTKKYNVNKLVYFEEYSDINKVIVRGKDVHSISNLFSPPPKVAIQRVFPWFAIS